MEITVVLVDEDGAELARGPWEHAGLALELPERVLAQMNGKPVGTILGPKPVGLTIQVHGDFEPKGSS